MNNRWVRMAVVFVLGLAALKGWEFSNGGGIIPASPIAEAVYKAGVKQRADMANVYGDLAERPPETVREAMETITRNRESLYEIHDKALADLMEPELGKAKLDPAKAKAVFAEVAKGLRK